jgi:hypothetical protein
VLSGHSSTNGAGWFRLQSPVQVRSLPFRAPAGCGRKPRAFVLSQAPTPPSPSAGPARCDGWRGRLLCNQGGPRLESLRPPGRSPAPRVAFRHPRRRRFWAPLQAAAFRKRGPSRVRRRQSRSAMCLSAVSGSATLLALRPKRSQRASWISGHLALLPGAGRLHVNVGWRHPRPAATNGGEL